MKTLFLAFTTLLFTHFNALACSKTLVMGTNETNWPPYLVKQGDTFLGAEVDAVNAIFKDSKFCIKWTYFPSFSRVQAELKNGRVDMTYAASYTKKRAQYAHFSLPYREEVMHLYKHKDSPDVTSLADLFSQDFTAGINRGSFFGDELEQLKTKYSKQVVLTAQANNRFSMLDKKRIDYVIEDSVVAQYFVKKHSSISQVKTITPINVNNVHFMLSKESLTLDDVTTVNQLITKNEAAIKSIYQPMH